MFYTFHHSSADILLLTMRLLGPKNPYLAHMKHRTLFYVCIALASLLDIPMSYAAHHMAHRAPLNLDRRKEPITPLLVTNYCPEVIWPGISTQSGIGPPEAGFRLAPFETKNQTVSEDWQGRVWGRTNCSFNEDGTAPKDGGPRACYTGDCNGVLKCIVGVCETHELNSNLGHKEQEFWFD
jgi:hypothetical protein